MLALQENFINDVSKGKKRSWKYSVLRSIQAVGAKVI